MKKLSGILLIDDDDTTNFLNKRLLDRMEVSNHIRTFVNGKQAFDYLYNVSNKNYEVESSEYFQPELIFLDINMPVMDGFEMLDLYERLNPEFRKKIVMVVLTTSTHPQDTANSKKYNAEYIIKPLTAEKVNRLLEVHFSDKGEEA
ncbi:response regulator receiver domain-containing protein [Pontibacter mucosus]|uniref:Response regulator receiver domain-containing protein n=1 Tax=Pontibacter mucosus TaxID=1649266 RepID=A0A2T5Y7I1_9BACT|nr:response regulator [Pontibacter mucosus]PTX12253.1 response regulator receiver domain-containing protein [Pontibacter mucosus]